MFCRIVESNWATARFATATTTLAAIEETDREGSSLFLYRRRQSKYPNMSFTLKFFFFWAEPFHLFSPPSPYKLRFCRWQFGKYCFSSNTPKEGRFLGAQLLTELSNLESKIYGREN